MLYAYRYWYEIQGKRGHAYVSYIRDEHLWIQGLEDAPL